MRVRLVLPAAAVFVAGLGYALVAQEKPKSAPAADPSAEAGLKKTTAAFMAAFHAGDARAVAVLWTENAEMIEADGDVFRGREAIEKAYAEAFKARPKATAKVENGSVRFLGPTIAIIEGVLTITTPGGAEPDVTEFSAVLVREGDEWKIASVKSTEPDPESGSLEEIEWLVGESTASTPSRRTARPSRPALKSSGGNPAADYDPGRSTARAPPATASGPATTSVGSAKRPA
jgi:uncharacterized protein (TIGR02246 family)